MDASNNRTFEQTEMTKLILEALLIASDHCKRVLGSQFDDLRDKIQNNKLDVRLVCREE